MRTASSRVCAPAFPFRTTDFGHRPCSTGFFAAALAKLVDSALGLKACEHWHPSHLGTLGYAWLSNLARTLVRETRHALACDYLRQRGRNLTEIAFLLGFSEPSAFSRAFRRWQGVSPSAYRQANTNTG